MKVFTQDIRQKEIVFVHRYQHPIHYAQNEDIVSAKP